MTDEDRAIVSYRLERATQTLSEARVLLMNQCANGATNRLYYACFYAVNALLRTSGLASRKHSGVRGLFNKHFVQTGLVSKDLAELYNDLFEKRQDGDYMDFVKMKVEYLEPLLPRADIFVNAITALVQERM